MSIGNYCCSIFINIFLFIFRKSIDNFNENRQTRPRANTITCTNKEMPLNRHSCKEQDQHLCAFDSVLHSTICSNLNASTQINPLELNTSKNRNKMRINSNTTTNTPVLKLKTSVLNQLNPNLTPEEKFSRKLYDVEKWLIDRGTIQSADVHKCKFVNKSPSNPINNATKTSTPQKPCENEIRKKYPLPHKLKQHKEELNKSNKMKMPFDYSNMPISGNASEFETLIDLSENEEEPENRQDNLDTASKSSSVRFVHIHHHFYHFDDDGKFE